MAYYAPTHLINSSFTTLPTELLQWSLWPRHPKQSPQTPPMTSLLQPRPQLQPTLPPITQLGLPDVPSWPSNDSARMPPVYEEQQYSATQFQEVKRPVREEGPHLIDWLDFTRNRSARFIAEKTCEMICYLWFSTRPSLQLVPSPSFVSFTQKVLETTQVSQSVIVLSLHYIFALKKRNRFTSGQPGSEFRITVAALMMANKFLDDNTYTNKTWSEVSGIELEEINRMEREFLKGVEFKLCVNESDYQDWLLLLKGLVMAKERDSQRLWRSRLQRTSRNPSARTVYTPRTRPSYHRARSTSPTESRVPNYPFVFTVPAPSVPAPSFSSPSLSLNVPSTTYPVQTASFTPPSASFSSPSQPYNYNSAQPESPTPQPGSKRSAGTAFSPTSANFSELPTKRPLSMSLEIPAPRSGPPSTDSHSPLEGLQSFADMSIGSSPQCGNTPVWMSSSSRVDSGPQTLVAAYRVDEQRCAAVPQNLYFYSLTSSPTESEEETYHRKARLRYHQPPPPMSTSYVPMPPSIPLNVQSATSSPRDVHMNLPPTLPHFHETCWERQPDTAPASRYDQYEPVTTQQQIGTSVPSAPFANAGPPGVQFYATPMQRQQSSPAHYSYHNWSRNRRF